MPWLVVCLVGIGTCLLRVIPLVWPTGRIRHASPRAAWLDALGPCLLMAMATTVVVPAVNEAAGQGAWLPLGCGCLAVAGMMLVFRDPGWATLAGMAAWWISAGWL